MDNCCVREMTLVEELESLVMVEGDKKRIIAKAERIIKENHLQGEYLSNCHREIDNLKNAIIEQAKIIGILKEEIRNMSIRPLNDLR
jgi:hypothetical protein